MIHVTIATGDTRRSPRSEVSADAIAAVAPLLHEGGEITIPDRGGRFSVRWTAPPGLGACLFTIAADGAPVVTCGVAREEQASRDLWQQLVTMHERVMGPLGAAARRIALTETPWLGVVLLPGVADLAPEDIAWLGDFERCLAWAWMDREEARHAPRR